jgi:hypothetical protein
MGPSLPGPEAACRPFQESDVRWPTHAAQSRLAHRDERSAVLKAPGVGADVGVDAVGMQTDAEQDFHGRAAQSLAQEEP